MLGVVHKRRP